MMKAMSAEEAARKERNEEGKTTLTGKNTNVCTANWQSNLQKIRSESEH